MALGQAWCSAQVRFGKAGHACLERRPLVGVEGWCENVGT